MEIFASFASVSWLMFFFSLTDLSRSPNLLRSFSFRMLFTLPKSLIHENIIKAYMLIRIYSARITVDDGTDETMNFYCKLIDKGSKKIKQGRESISRIVLKYRMLVCRSPKPRTSLKIPIESKLFLANLFLHCLKCSHKIRKCKKISDVIDRIPHFQRWTVQISFGIPHLMFSK
jgi:hypothetical protein